MNASVWLLLVALSASPAQDDAALRALEEADADTFAAALEALTAAGEAGALEALEGFREREFVARRARAFLLAEVGAAATVTGILAVLDDPDPEVRRLLARALGARSMAAARAGDRVDALAALAADDLDRGVRAAALEALQDAALPGAPAAVDGLLEDAPETDAPRVAEALVALPDGRRQLVARVRSAFLGPGEAGVADDVLAILLAGYGRALIDLPRGGSDPSDRLPFVRGYRHPSQRVRLAAFRGLAGALGRLYEFAQYERADAFLAALAEEGLPRHDLLYRRVSLALSQRGDAPRALVLANELEDAATLAPVDERATYRLYGLHFQGAAHFALGDFAEARRQFERAEELLRALLEERLDLSRREVQSLGGAIMVDRLELVALESLWQALCFLAEGVPASDRAVLELARTAHAALLRARVVEVETDAQPIAADFDSVLGRDLAPGPLLIRERRIERFHGGRGDDLLVALGRALATVARWELPGFEPLEGLSVENALDRRLLDPLFDVERLESYARYRQGYESFVRRRYLLEVQRAQRSGVDNPVLRRTLQIQLQEIGRMQQLELERAAEFGDPASTTPGELLDVYRNLVDLATRPSLFGMTLATALRDDGRASEARLVGERMLADLRANGPSGTQVWEEWASARIELMIGSSYMDEDRPVEAERVCTNAVRRLEELENALVADGADPETDGTIRRVRDMRASALISLAVNANVRLDDQVRALEYFERAFELDQRDYMQVLLACYRARSGREEEARAVLRTLQPTPALYYNLACTHALLGDTREAVDFLQREFTENHPTAGSRERQRQWAGEDPDLASLRTDPAFRRLVGLDD